MTSARRIMHAGTRAAGISLVALAVACSPASDTATPGTAESDANAGIDSLNARLSRTYREKDPRKYGGLFTDSAVFEWPSFNTVRGRAGLEAMARSNWAALRDMDLQLTVATRRIIPNHVTEFGSFRQSWTDSGGRRMAEYGRYVALLNRGADGEWRIDRFFGFSDSTRPLTPRP